MRTRDDLRQALGHIDRRGYKAYKDIQGSYDFGDLELHLDHVQGDPFAAPSKLRLRFPQSHAALPADLFDGSTRTLAFADFLARRVAAAIHASIPRPAEGRSGGSRGSGKSGLVRIDAGGQEVLERTAIRIDETCVEARLEVGLPATGRRVLGRVAEMMLCDELPRLAEQTLLGVTLPEADARRFVHGVENQEALRRRLDAMGLVAFLADGAVLPRESGASDRPMTDGAVPLLAPDTLAVEVELPHPIDASEPASTRVRGLGIPRGVSLVVGGGYHGKSTLLHALERSVHPHVPGDGREITVTRGDAVKIRAEDGRSVEACDISAFIENLPQGRSTRCFSSDDASGSTSQAASILEALEVGAGLLLLDEDTSATNFMVRDARMQALVHKEHEPITPFLDRVRELYDTLGVSTVLVMGGSGDYFDVADTVLEMRDYRPRDATREARAVAEAQRTRRHSEASRPFPGVTARIPLASSLDASRRGREVKIDARDRDRLGFGEDWIDLRGVEQILDRSQTRAIGYAIHLLQARLLDDGTTLAQALDALDRILDEQGLDVLDPFRRGEQHPGNFARPRRFEIAAAMNRLRSIRMAPSGA